MLVNPSREEHNNLLKLTLLLLLFCSASIAIGRKASVRFIMPDADHGLVTTIEARRIAINTASVFELEELPGIGPALARRIVRYREQSGPIENHDDLGKIPGLGEKTIDRLEDYIVYE